MGLYDWMTPEEKQMMMSNQLIGLGAGLLQNSGYSPVKTTTGQALGSGLAGMMGAAKSSMGDIQDKRKMETMKRMEDQFNIQSQEDAETMKALKEYFRRKQGYQLGTVDGIPFQYSYPVGGTGNGTF